MVRVVLEVTASAESMRSIENGIYDALDEAVSNTLAYGETFAKRKAPVRKVTRRGVPARTRELTQGEIAELPDFARKGLNPVTGRSIRTGELPRTTTRIAGAARLVPTARIRGKTYKLGGETGRDVRYTESGEPKMRNERFAQLLSSRGNYELRSGRGVYTRQLTAMVGTTLRHAERSTLGGRLRGEINSKITSFATRGGIAEGILESPTEYAQYVEFPTSRTAAQPYIRPAREAMRPRLIRNIELEMRRVGG